MGELAARLGLHFAIDRMVDANAITIDQIVPLVQAYDPARGVPRRPPAPPSFEPTDVGPADGTDDGTDDHRPDEPRAATPTFDPESTPDALGLATVQRSEAEAAATAGEPDAYDERDERDAKVIDDGEPSPEDDERSTSRKLAAVGWATDAAKLLRREIPNASDALTTLAVRDREIEPIDAARRIRSLWLAMQVAELATFNGTDPGGITKEAIVDALEPVLEQFPPDVERYPPERYRATTASSVTAETLMDLITDIKTAEEFHQQFASTASAYLRADVAWAAAVECHDSTMYVDVTSDGVADTDVAAVMTTSLAIPNTTNLTVADLRQRMHPDNWPSCLPTFWCKMEPCPSGADTLVVHDEFVRQEFVGDFQPPTPCQIADAWFRPILRFRHRDVPKGDGFELQFDLAADPIPGATQDDRFLVDAGAMNVRLRDGTILVRTSKVLLLSPPISAIGLTILACALGYGDMGTAMLTKALE